MAETRRSIIRRGLMAIGAIASLGVAGRPSAAPAPLAGAGRLLTLHGTDWHIESADLAAGRLPQPGQRMLASGQLMSSPDGESIGEFIATYVSLNAPDGFGALASAEQHTLKLHDGSIMGMGTTGEGLDSEDEFAIVGGTGRYAGARGSYLVRQNFYEFGGDGTATITLRLITEVA